MSRASVEPAGFDGFKRHCSYFPHSGSVLSQIGGVPAWCSVSSKGTLQFPVIGHCRRRWYESSYGHA